MAEAQNLAKVISDAILQAAKENPSLVTAFMAHVEDAATVSTSLIPNVARRLREHSQPQAALITAALYGMIRCFGFWGFIVLLFKLRFPGGENAGASN